MNTSTTRLADKPTLADGPPSEARVNLEVCSYLADEPSLADGPPTELRRDALNTTTPKLADEPTLADGPPTEYRLDALNTTTPNLADEPTLANGNFTLLLTSNGQEWQFHIATDI